MLERMRRLPIGMERLVGQKIQRPRDPFSKEKGGYRLNRRASKPGPPEAVHATAR
jgi:hypothetical protein